MNTAQHSDPSEPYLDGRYAGEYVEQLLERIATLEAAARAVVDAESEWQAHETIDDLRKVLGADDQ